MEVYLIVAIVTLVAAGIGLVVFFASKATPVNCVQGPWENSGECVAGKRNQIRKIVTASANGGTACGAEKQTVTCIDTSVKMGRYVYLEGLCLNIAAIEVISNGVDVALGRGVEISRVYLDDWAQFGPQFTTDGNPQSYCHTQCNGDNQYVQVDLGSLYPISSIRIVHRQDCCESRLVGINIQIRDEQKRAVWSVKTEPPPGAKEVSYSMKT